MKKKCDVFYVRNFISLIHCASISTQFKNLNYKILYLNYAWINKEVFLYFKKFLFIYFDEIITFNYKTIDNLNSNFFKEKKFNFFHRIFLRTKNLNNFNKKLKFKKNIYKVENIFSGGDDFHLLFEQYKKIYYVEHGIGNYRDGLIFKQKKILTLVNYFFKFLNLLGFKIFFLKKFDAYISILSNKIRLNLNINNYEVKYLNTQKKYFVDVLKKMSEQIGKNSKKLPFINKKKVFLNISGFIHVNEKESKNLIKIVLTKISKNEIVIFKDHPRLGSKNDKIKKMFIDELKKRSIKHFEIKDVFFKKLPMELLIYLVKSHKLISSWSSTPLFCSVLFNQKFKNILLLEYSLKFPEDFEAKRNNKIYDIVKKKFKNITFL